MVERRHEKKLNSLPSLEWTIGNCNNDLTKALKNGISFVAPNTSGIMNMNIGHQILRR